MDGCMAPSLRKSQPRAESVGEEGGHWPLGGHWAMGGLADELRARHKADPDGAFPRTELSPTVAFFLKHGPKV